ncbi:MAG: hypothetical protein SV487_10265 [Thermodesulfobacteriota bacterium]|nr:hypothetical protein [Thermodesulfobacteriota bacterium]
MYEEDKPKKKKKKPGEWSPLDILLTILGLAVLIALTAGAFKLAKWAVATYL